MTSPEDNDKKSADASEWTTLAGFGLCITYMIFLIATHLREGGAAMTLPHESAVLNFALIPARAFGLLGAYLATACLSGMALVLWMKRTLNDLPRRAVGLPLLILALSSLVALIEGNGSIWGGQFGETLRDAFQFALPQALAYLVAATLVVFGAYMARDWFFFEEVRRLLSNHPASPAFALGIGGESQESENTYVQELKSSPRRTATLERPSFDLGSPISLDTEDGRLELSTPISSLGSDGTILDDLDPLETENAITDVSLDPEAPSPKEDDDMDGTTSDDSVEGIVNTQLPDTEALELAESHDSPDEELTFGELETSEPQQEEAADEEEQEEQEEQEDDGIPQLDWSQPISAENDFDLFGEVLEPVDENAEQGEAEAVVEFEEEDFLEEDTEELEFEDDDGEDENNLEASIVEIEEEETSAEQELEELEELEEEEELPASSSGIEGFGPDTQALLDSDLDELFEEEENPVYEVQDYENKVIEVDAYDEASDLEEIDYETAPPRAFHDDEMDNIEGELVDEPEEVEFQQLLFSHENDDMEWGAIDQIDVLDAAEEEEEEEGSTPDLGRYAAPASITAENPSPPAPSKGESRGLDDDWAPWGEDSAPPRPAALEEVKQDSVLELEKVEDEAGESTEDEEQNALEDWDNDDFAGGSIDDAFAQVEEGDPSDEEFPSEDENLTGIIEAEEGEEAPEKSEIEEIAHGPSEVNEESGSESESSLTPDAVGESAPFEAPLTEEMPAPVQAGAPESPFDALAETFYQEAVSLCLEQDSCRISFLQRNLRIDFAQAAAIIERMESEGLVGPYSGSGSHEILVDHDDWQAGRI